MLENSNHLCESALILSETKFLFNFQKIKHCWIDKIIYSVSYSKQNLTWFELKISMKELFLKSKIYIEKRFSLEIGNLRSLFPVAAKIALQSAALIVGSAISPNPSGFSSPWTK